MQPYQEEYIDNLKEITSLTAHKRPEGQSFEEYYMRSLEDQALSERKLVRNMELLRDELFPELDRLPEADGAVLSDLQEFASKLLTYPDELDAGLFCQIRRALLSLMRLGRDRNGIIRELYWLGIGRNNLCNKLVGLELAESEKYMLKMRLCFAEAAAYLKYYDEIDSAETRGYILRSRANISLGQFKSPGEKIRLTKRTLQIMQDKAYQEKEPNLPWERFISMTHQQMTASISRSRTGIMSPEDIADVMESVYIVYHKMLQDMEEQKINPSCRSSFSYFSINYYCGLDTLDGLLTKMEMLMDSADDSDFSQDTMYGMISIPAFYCQYLQEHPEKLPMRTEYLENLYRRILRYVETFPESAGSESLFFYLRQLAHTFVETRNSITYGDFLQTLITRFAPDIYVHSYLVGKAASVLCGIIMEEEPSYFDDMEHIRSIRDPGEKRRKTEEYAMQCGIFHDVGKLNFTNLYSQMGRQWFEEEYEMSQLHTIVGRSRLSASPSTRLYAPAAHGHHAWYDGSRGYPESYRRLECPFRQMVDVIGLIDFLESMTSTEQLHRGPKKTFSDAVEEAVSLEGKRFSPLLTARLRDKEVAQRLEHTLTASHREAYLRLYEREALPLTGTGRIPAPPG